MIASTTNSSADVFSAPATSATDKQSLRRYTPDTIIEDALLSRFATGDESAFVEIMERYRGKIFAITMGILRNHADAEEITQDTFIRAHRALANFRGDSSLATWLYRIAVNLSRNRYRYFLRRRRNDSFSLDCPLNDDNAGTLSDIVADPGHDPSQETVSSEFCKLVERCMELLTARQREILTLRNTFDNSYDDISTTLGISVGTVKSRIGRARATLRTRLLEKCPEFSRDASLGDWFLPRRPASGRTSVVSS